MKRLALVALIITVMVATAAVLAPSADAGFWRTCSHVPDTKTGKVQAGAGTHCAQANLVYKRLAATIVATGHVYEGRVLTWSCDYTPSGHVVYVCKDGELRMRVWAGVRTTPGTT